MAIINCPECGKEISDTCKKCIHCGYSAQTANANIRKNNFIEKFMKCGKVIEKYKFAIIAVLIIAALVVGFLYLSTEINKRDPFEKLYKRQTRAEVHELMGSPDEVLPGTDYYNNVNFLGKTGVLSINYVVEGKKVLVDYACFNYYFYRDDWTSKDREKYLVAIDEFYDEIHTGLREGRTSSDYTWRTESGERIDLNVNYLGEYPGIQEKYNCDCTIEIYWGLLR